MVAPSKKRKLPNSTGPAPKRSKNAKVSKPQSKKTNKPAARRVVDANALSWQSVGEEFGCLEVIEGVDVVKHGDRVQFVVAEDPKAAQADDAAADDDKTNDDEGDSFEGFGDDVVEGGHLDAGEASSREGGLEGEGPQGKDKGKDSKKKKNKKADKRELELGSAQKDQLDKAQKDVQKSAPHGNSFNALAAMDDAEEEDIDMEPWVQLNLSPRILSAIAKLKFPNPTAIQRKAIPQIIAGEDVIGKAQTGSGKTLAFGIPMVEIGRAHV